MGELSTGNNMDHWVCPNDRQLALRAKLGAGWSVHTNKFSSFQRDQHLSLEEQEQIMNVIARADLLDQVEQERIGHLVDKLENMKKNAMGNGTTQCILCGDEFGLMGASPVYCDDCKKAVCTKCGVDTSSSMKQPLWLCKICSESREVWKKSGAWFFKGLPKYVIPQKKVDSSRSMPNRGKTDKRGSHRGRTSTGRHYNTWHRGRGTHVSYGESSDQESESSSDDDISIGKKKSGKKAADSESDNISLSSTHSGGGGGYNYGTHIRQESKSSITSGNLCGSQLSATESSRGDDIHDASDSESIGGYGSVSSSRSQSSSYQRRDSRSRHY